MSYHSKFIDASRKLDVCKREYEKLNNAFDVLSKRYDEKIDKIKYLKERVAELKGYDRYETGWRHQQKMMAIEEIKEARTLSETRRLRINDLEAEVSDLKKDNNALLKEIDQLKYKLECTLGKPGTMNYEVSFNGPSFTIHTPDNINKGVWVEENKYNAMKALQENYNKAVSVIAEMIAKEIKEGK